MRKVILSLLILIIGIRSFAQADTSRYYWQRYYGLKITRLMVTGLSGTGNRNLYADQYGRILRGSIDPQFIIIGAGNVGTGAGVYKGVTAQSFDLRSLNSPTDGGIIVTQNTSDISFTDAAFDVKGKLRGTTTSATTLSKYFNPSLVNNSNGVITVWISGMTSSGSWTTVRTISYNIISGSGTFGTEQVTKAGEAIGTFTTPTVTWTLSANWPQINVTAGDTATTWWTISYEVSVNPSPL